MHEIGMLRQAAELADRIAEENGSDEVQEIVIELGELAGVVPQIFTDYFGYFSEQYPRLKNTELKLHTVKGEGLCSDCKCLYNIMKQEGTCPRCGSKEKMVLGGTEVKVVSVTC